MQTVKVKLALLDLGDIHKCIPALQARHAATVEGCSASHRRPGMHLEDEAEDFLKGWV